jgi:hypothetical protein
MRMVNQQDNDILTKYQIYMCTCADIFAYYDKLLPRIRT